jgi:diguanylate cyclase (GGDEF)-like protein
MTPRADSNSALRLLIVEDDLPSADLLRDLLNTSQIPRFDIQHVTTAGEARRVVETGQPDLVILDLGLPDATDLEALTGLEDSIHEVPVIVLTGRGDESLASDALHRGAEDYLLKGTINLESLLRSIRYAIERHQSIRDMARLKKQLERANRDLERLTLIDPLTELLNRRGLQQAISREVQQLQRGLKGAAILLVDLDDFKTVNSNLGHAAGDVVLKEIGRRLRASVQAIDYVGRVGGDVFMLILPETDHDQVKRIAEQVRLAIATSIIQHNSGTVTLTASIASVMLTTDMPAIDQLLARGHLLLSRAKSEGKNRVIFEPVDFDDTDQRRQAQSDMCSNLSRGKYMKTVKQHRLRVPHPLRERDFRDAGKFFPTLLGAERAHARRSRLSAQCGGGGDGASALRAIPSQRVSDHASGHSSGASARDFPEAAAAENVLAGDQ